MMCKIEITYDSKTVQKPLIYEMTKRYDIVFNIYRAIVDEQFMGHLILEIEGASKAVNQAIEFLELEGVQVEIIQTQIVIDRLRCHQCGACAGACFTRALKIGEDSGLIFDKSRCISCYNCIEACDVQAIEKG
ncbi:MULTISPECIES: NIL domain-containing protein [unclassified Fusibacter]|uniref:NIL domain-containing protein n=1 Tax=unclassified Fusibacter TaxID=2624464 RepID=UPI001010F1BC|nr:MULTISPECIES: NIL domain-containing protein [unclassified Fusibacter]MCK8058318.1 4Fe-4S binding protein [Fusibacter sp. A2]NPE20901.1 4Fe-4S binding protein [Fusibacter sp. A1]RXV63105.1 hypothetical protein DWB64_03635 [Fusibacter sp. A1]